MINGAQAEAYADHFIAVHLKAIGGGKTYAQLSTQAQADPTNTKLAGHGRTPCSRARRFVACCSTATRSGRWASSRYAGRDRGLRRRRILLLLSALGFLHLRRTDPTAELLPRLGAHIPAPVEP